MVIWLNIILILNLQAGFEKQIANTNTTTPLTLSVDQLNVNSDNLDEAFYSSQYAV